MCIFISSVCFYPKGFVKMVAANVSVMEEQVIEAEGEARTLPGAFKKIFRTMNVSGFLNVRDLTEQYVNVCLSV